MSKFEKTACPECGSHDVVPRIDGLPGSDLEARAILGEVMLGGCVVFGSSPDLGCNPAEPTGGTRARSAASRRRMRTRGPLSFSARRAAADVLRYHPFNPRPFDKLRTNGKASSPALAEEIREDRVRAHIARRSVSPCILLHFYYNRNMKLKPQKKSVARLADMISAMGNEHRLMTMRLLLASHPAGMVWGTYSRSSAFRARRSLITWKSSGRRGLPA